MRLTEQRLEFVQIHARTKCLARAGDDDHLRFRLLDLIQRRKQFAYQFEAHRIPFVRTVERDDSDALLETDLQRTVIHYWFVILSGAKDLLFLIFYRTLGTNRAISPYQLSLKSSQVGFPASIIAIFLLRNQPLIAFSRAIAFPTYLNV